MKITIKSAQVGLVRWATFSESADLSDFDPAKILNWNIEFHKPTTGTLIDASTGVEGFGGKRKTDGTFVDSNAANLAYELSFAKRHMISVTGPGVSITEVTKESLDQIPHEVIVAFRGRIDPTSRVTEAELRPLLKPTPEDPAEPVGSSDTPA